MYSILKGLERNRWPHNALSVPVIVENFKKMEFYLAHCFEGIIELFYNE
jgi:hypothetical protein